MTTKICIFDFDGVIGDSKQVTFDIHNRIREKYGLEEIKSREDYLKTIDNNHLKDYMPQEHIGAYYLDCNAEYERQLKEIRVFPAIQSYLQETKEDTLIISSNPDRMIREILRNHGIDRVMIFGKEKARNKIARLDLVLQEKKISKDNIIYVGDTIDDYQFCREAGIPMIGSSYGYSNLEEVKDALIDLVHSPEELVEKVKQYTLVR